MSTKVTALRPDSLREVHRLLPRTVHGELQYIGSCAMSHRVEIPSLFAHALVCAVGEDDLLFVCERFHEPRSVGIGDAAATLRTSDFRAR